MNQRSKIIWIVCTLVIASLFVLRGPWRALSSSSDLRGPYTASVLWMEGHNPYDSKELTQTHIRQGGTGRVVQFLHPPGVLPLLMPLAAFDWITAKLIWMIINLAATASIIRSLLVITPKAKHQRALLALGALAFSPLHTAIQLGQLSLISIAFGLAAFARIGPKPSIISAALIALSATFKPQIGLVFLVYLAATARFRDFANALFISLAILGIGVGGMISNDISVTSIQAEWKTNFSESNSVKGGDRFTEANPARSNLINLHIFLSALTQNRSLVSFGVLLIVLAGCLIWLGLYHRRSDSAPLAIKLSIPLLLSLLVIYHRTYDALVLLLPLSWAITEWKEDQSKMASIVLGFGSIFFVPGGAIIAWAQTTGRVPTTLLDHLAWKAIAVPHASLAILAISVALLVALARIKPERPENPAPSPDRFQSSFSGTRNTEDVTLA